MEGLETLKEVDLPTIQVQLVDDEVKGEEAESKSNSSENDAIINPNKTLNTSSASFMSNFSTPKWINFRRVFSFNRSTPRQLGRVSESLLFLFAIFIYIWFDIYCSIAKIEASFYISSMHHNKNFLISWKIFWKKPLRGSYNIMDSKYYSLGNGDST